jgi:hypothetical protein
VNAAAARQRLDRLLISAVAGAVLDQGQDENLGVALLELTGE